MNKLHRLFDALAALTPVIGTQNEGRWRIGCMLSLANCVSFLVISLLIFVVKPQSTTIIQIAPSIFSVGSLVAFAFMVRGGAVLLPIAWYIVGAGIFFGLGSVAGGLRVHMYSDQIYGANNIYLTRVNLLNACSALIVVFVAFISTKITEPSRLKNHNSVSKTEDLLGKTYPYLLLVATIGVISKYVEFPNAENLLLRSVLAKIHLFIPACFLILGIIQPRLSWAIKISAFFIFSLDIFHALVLFSKYQFFSTLLAFAIGKWVKNTSWRFLILSNTCLVLMFVAVNPLITFGRAHIAYDPEKNTLLDRIGILRDVSAVFLNTNAKFITVSDGRQVQMNLEYMNRPSERAKAIARRFDIASVQGYLINEYDTGHPGNTLSNFWVTFVPRFIWQDKPIMSNLGGELHRKYFNDPSQIYSSLAPTYSAEAYWNYGSLGVAVVSALMGLGIGWLSHYALLGMQGVRLEYFLVAFSVTTWAAFVESWIVSAYLGAFVIFMVILLIFRILLSCSQYYKMGWQGLTKFGGK